MTVAAYADYSFYSTSYLLGRSPTVTQQDFPYYAQQASAVIDSITFGNIKSDVPDKVRLCCCEIAEQMYANSTSQSAQKAGVASESVQGWSQSYESTQARQEAAQAAYSASVYKWLSGTGLLYSGVR